MNAAASSKKVRGLFAATLSILLWGVTFVCTKSLLKDFSPMEILFFRFVLAYFSLWIIHPVRMKVPVKDNILFALAGLSGVTIYQFSENLATVFTTASNVSIIVSICPIFTAVIAQIFLKEKHITFKFVLGFIIAISGITLVSLNGLNTQNNGSFPKISLSNLKGDLLALLSAVSWGFYSLFVTLINRKKYDSLCSTRRVFFFAVIFMIPLIISGNIFSNQTGQERNLFYYIAVNWDTAVNKARFTKPSSWINLVFLGFFASAVCFSLWNKACNYLGTVKATTGIYLIPVVTIVFAAIILGETITPLQLLGAGLAITGLFVSTPKSEEKELSKEAE